MSPFSRKKVYGGENHIRASTELKHHQHSVCGTAQPRHPSAGGGDGAPGQYACQGEVDVQDQLMLFQVYHNFVWPHASLR
jgi:hypothetical protein